MFKDVIGALIFFMILPFGIVKAQQEIPLSYYLNEVEFDPNVPTPEAFLGFQIGEWHITHDQLVSYMRKLAETSDRVLIHEYARSHENKALVHLIISNPSNLEQLDTIKAKHLKLSLAEQSDSVNVESLPAVIYQGYSIHGNESSGSNASALVAYYLAAGQGSRVQKTLDDLVILLDPCMNPDGLQRFSTWVNSNRFTHLIGDPSSREFNEPWPKGRTNHYWFDLNRDWLLLTHPESRGRVKVFHEWNPVVLTDHHEMGSSSSFFFQPGVPSRTNPLTPQVNQDLTEEISLFHAEALDSIGSDYFSKERFDDFYYGKGSTYPDVHGCIGILFEQASARGHLRLMANKQLSFPFAIRNQVVTSLSTQKAASTLKAELLNYKRNFFKKTAEEGASGNNLSYQVWDNDRVKINYLLEILNRHQIKTYSYDRGSDIYGFQVPLNQKQHRLIKSLFEPVNEFKDSIFYDVSTWHFPSAFNVAYQESAYADISTLNEISTYPFINSLDTKAKNFYFDWNQYNAPALMNELLQNEYKLYRATVNSKGVDAINSEARDIIYVPKQEMDKNKLFYLAEKWEVELSRVEDKSTTVQLLDPFPIDYKKIALLVGNGTSSYDVGHSWFQMDYRWSIDHVNLDNSFLNEKTLSKYDVLLMPSGNYSRLNIEQKKLTNWIENGGTIIAFKNAIDFLNENGFIKLESNESLLGEQESDSPGQVIGGSIYMANINPKHPLCFGYNQKQLALFKKGKNFYKIPDKSAAVALKYPSNSKFSGYGTEEHKKMAENSFALAGFRKGKGRIICMVDDPNFRGFWLGGSKLFANMLFFSSLLDEDELINAEE